MFKYMCSFFLKICIKDIKNIFYVHFAQFFIDFIAVNRIF